MFGSRSVHSVHVQSISSLYICFSTYKCSTFSSNVHMFIVQMYMFICTVQCTCTVYICTARVYACAHVYNTRACTVPRVRAHGLYRACARMGAHCTMYICTVQGNVKMEAQEAPSHRTSLMTQLCVRLVYFVPHSR